MKFDHEKYINDLMESLNSQFDLDPSICDNVDPRIITAKRLSFMQSRLEDVISGKIGDYNSKDIYIEQELLEAFSFSDSYAKLAKIANPKKVAMKIKNKFANKIEKIIGKGKVKEIMKNSKEDVKFISNEFRKINPNGDKKSQKEALMKITQNYVKKKYSLDEVKDGEKEGSAILLLFNGVLFFVFLNFINQDIRHGDDGMLIFDSVLALWCLYDSLKHIILLSTGN